MTKLYTGSAHLRRLFFYGRVTTHHSERSHLNVWLLYCCVILFASSGQTQEKQAAVLKPLTVCEILDHLKQYEGQNVAVLGRFSFRTDGRWVSEDNCAPFNADARAAGPALIWLAYEPQSAPRMSSGYQMDGATVEQKLAQIKKRTSLKQFRFGTPDYDRWAVVYGEIRLPENPAARARHDAPAELVYAGDGYVMFLHDTASSRAISR